MPSKAQSYLHLRLFGRTGKYEKNQQSKFKSKIGNFFVNLYKFISINLIRKEVITMTKDKKEAKQHPEEKKTEAKSEAKSSCGCGCVPPMKKAK